VGAGGYTRLNYERKNVMREVRGTRDYTT